MCLYFGTRGTTTNATTSKEEHKHKLIDVINQVINQNTVCSAAVLYNGFKMLDLFIVISNSYINLFLCIPIRSKFLQQNVEE